MKVGKRIFLLLLALLMAMPGGQAATVLEVGSSGENVRKVQQRLIQYDYLDGEAAALLPPLRVPRKKTESGRLTP